MIHSFNWNKISKTMPVSGLVLASAGTTFFQTLSTKAEENIDLDISLVAVKPNGTQVIELEINGVEKVIEVTKEQIAMVEAEIAKVGEVKQDSMETIIELATESLPQWMVTLTIVTGYLAGVLRVWFGRMLAVYIETVCNLFWANLR